MSNDNVLKENDMADKELNIDDIISESDRWDNRELGASVEFVQVASDEEMENFKKAITSPVKVEVLSDDDFVKFVNSGDKK